jgi:hypothetical protein
MRAQQYQDACQEPNQSPCITVTLNPLFTHGQDALDTHDTPEIAKATLSEVEILSRNPADGVTLRRAEDLFAARTRPAVPAPSTGTLASATFLLYLTNALRPHRVSIRPPDQLTLEYPADAPFVFPWLDKRQFRLPAKLAQTALAILLALATAACAAADVADTDEDQHAGPQRRAVCA